MEKAKRKSKRKGWTTLKIRIPDALLERFKAKIPQGRRSRYIRMCIELIENDINFMELQAALTEKQLLEWKYRIAKKKQETEIAYRKKEIIT